MPILGILASSFAGAASDYESIATVTVGSGGASSVTFSSIGTDWTHLQIRATVLAGANYTDINFNSDFGANYTFHQLLGDGGSVSAAGGGSQNQIYGIQMSGSTSNPAVMVMDLLDYRNTNKFKTVRLLSGRDGNGSGDIYFRSGVWMNTNAVNAIRITAQGGTSSFNQHTTFALYGIKAA